MMLMRIAGIALLIGSVALISYDTSSTGSATSLTSVQVLWGAADLASLNSVVWFSQAGSLSWFMREMLSLPAGPIMAVLGILALWIAHRWEGRVGVILPALPLSR
jgi:hypothetical protein